MNSEQHEDILNLEEILKLMINGWKALIVISFAVFTLATIYLNIVMPLYKSSVLIIPGGDSPQSSAGSLLAVFGGLSGTPLPQDNSEKIKLYATSSLVLKKVLEKLPSEDLDQLRPWLSSHFFGLKLGSNNPNYDLRQLAFVWAKFITIQTPDDATSALLISIETPSVKISKTALEHLIEEMRNFYNQNEQEKRKRQEQFFESESSKYREKMFRNSLNISRLTSSPNAQSGLIELTPEDLDLAASLNTNVQTSPQTYFEYQSIIQDMYKTFAKSLEQNFQSMKIDSARTNVLFDVIETAYSSESPSSPNTLKTLIISTVFIIFIFAFYVFVLPAFKSILYNK